MTVSATLCVSSLQQRLFSQKETQTGGVENVLSVQKTVCRARLLNCSLGAVGLGVGIIWARLLNCSLGAVGLGVGIIWARS